jgi:hypothetical protein
MGSAQKHPLAAHLDPCGYIGVTPARGSAQKHPLAAGAGYIIGAPLVRDGFCSETPPRGERIPRLLGKRPPQGVLLRNTPSRWIYVGQPGANRCTARGSAQKHPLAEACQHLHLVEDEPQGVLLRNTPSRLELGGVALEPVHPQGVLLRNTPSRTSSKSEPIAAITAARGSAQKHPLAGGEIGLPSCNRHEPQGVLLRNTPSRGGRRKPSIPRILRRLPSSPSGGNGFPSRCPLALGSCEAGNPGTSRHYHDSWTVSVVVSSEPLIWTKVMPNSSTFCRTMLRSVNTGKFAKLSWLLSS